jgi:lipoyl(octanoyl) transferase
MTTPAAAPPPYAKLGRPAQCALPIRPVRTICVTDMELIDGIEWRVSEGQVPYDEALAFMERRAADVREGNVPECVWLLEHPPLFTAGTSADPAELTNPMDFPVYEAGRGGRYTYHGPGQRVGYVILDLEKRGKDIRRFVHSLEGWMIDSLAELGVCAHRADGRIGIWVGDGSEEAKIGALGVRVKRWVTLHGFAINVAPDLSHFGGIVPCGISKFGVTSLAELGKQMPLAGVDAALKQSFHQFLNGLERPCKDP